MLRLDGVSPLLLAAQEGHLGVVKLLVKEGADVNVSIQGYTPLYLAVQQGHTKVTLLTWQNPVMCHARL